MRLQPECPASEDACYTMPSVKVRLADLNHAAGAIGGGWRSSAARFALLGRLTPRSGQQRRQPREWRRHQANHGVDDALRR